MAISVLQVVPANAGCGTCENSNWHSIATHNNNNIVFDKLPIELQVLSLKGLSIKELARLRLVCKYFNSLLSAEPTLYEPPVPQFFLHSHLLDWCPAGMSLGNSIFFLHDETRGTSRWIPPFSCSPSLYLCSNDGFLCFEGHRQRNLPTIIVYNPTSRDRWNVLTVPERKPIVLRNCLIGIAFVGKLGACKIVVSGSNSKGMTWTLIYDAKVDTWRKLPDLNDTFAPRMKEAFVLNGLFYWLVRSYKQQTEMVVSLHIENEKWEEPLVLNRRCDRPICMAEVEEQPWVISVNAHNSQKLELWKLNTQGKRNHTWVRTITAPLHLESSNKISAFGGRNVLCIGRKGIFWAYHIEEKVWTYVELHHADIWGYRNFAEHKCAFYKPSLLRFQGDKLLHGKGHFLNVKVQYPGGTFGSNQFF